MGQGSESDDTVCLQAEDGYSRPSLGLSTEARAEGQCEWATVGVRSLNTLAAKQ